MNERKFSEMIDPSKEIRKLYRELKNKFHGTPWSIKEEALAFLTDAGLVGRLIMDQEKR